MSSGIRKFSSSSVLLVEPTLGALFAYVGPCFAFVRPLLLPSSGRCLPFVGPFFFFRHDRLENGWRTVGDGLENCRLETLVWASGPSSVLAGLM